MSENELGTCDDLKNHLHYKVELCRNFVASPQATRPDDRTPQDYAIEFGEYLAKAAEQFLEQSNLYDKAEADGTEPDYDALSDCWRGLQSAIGEFRKRAKRAAQPAAGTTPRPPGTICGVCNQPFDDPQAFIEHSRKCEGTTPQAERPEVRAAERIFGISVEAEHNRGPEWGVETIAAVLREEGLARAVAPVETPDVLERLWCSYPDCPCEREHDGVCQYKRAVRTFQEKYDRADKSPIILSWDDAYLILRMLKGGK